MRAAALLIAVLALAAAACGGDDGGAAARTAGERVAGLPESCSALHYPGGGRPSVVIVSSLPLQGAFVRDGVQGTEAIKMTLEQHGYRAGSHTVGYVSCDEWTVNAEEDAAAKCAANANAFAAAPSVVAVIGPYLSTCAIVVLPILNLAPKGPLSAVGPGNTYVGLTRRGPGAAPGHPRRLYPTGRRNFVRLAAPDDLQGRVHAKLAGDAGIGRAYVLTDGADAYSTGTAAAFTDAAGEAGISIVGRETWDPDGKSYAALARRVEGSGAEGVFLGGHVGSNGWTLLRDLRARLGPEVRIMAPEGFLYPRGDLLRAGVAAEGLMVTVSAVANERLTGAGAEFLDEFRKRMNQDPCCYTVHVAQAAHVLLDAIAASDGTRQSVTDRLFGLRVKDGLIGDFAFEANGDIDPPLVSVYTVERGKQQFLTAVEGS
jgi:branched-chain amino acid transport system substrate-binding protein